MNDLFKFEKGDEDFPFYNGKPLLSNVDWLILFAGVLLFIAVLEIINIPYEYCPLTYFLVTFLPLAYVSRGKLGIFFKKPKTSDISTILKCFVGYWIYAIIALSILSILGGKSTSNAAVGADMNMIFWINTFIQIMAEELLKLILLLIIMFIVYYFTQNRKKSVIISVLLTLLIFGLLHHTAYNNSWAQIIFIIGLGSFFYLFAYLKTKNIVNSFIVHLMIDWFAFGMAALSTSALLSIPQISGMVLSLI